MIIPPGFGLAALHLLRTGDPEPYVVTFGFKVDTAPFLLLHATNMYTALRTHLDDLASTQETFSRLVVTVGTDGPPDIFDVPGVLAGVDAATNRCPPQVAVLVKKNTSLGGRRGRGRLFWPSIDEAAVGANGVIPQATVTAYQTKFNDLFAAFELATNTFNADGLFVLHSEGLSAAPPPTRMTGFAVQSLVATQRRRVRR